MVKVRIKEADLRSVPRGNSSPGAQWTCSDSWRNKDINGHFRLKLDQIMVSEAQKKKKSSLVQWPERWQRALMRPIKHASWIAKSKDC